MHEVEMDKPLLSAAPHSAPRRPHGQHGVVLIVALVMLVIIGLASVAIMRNVMTNDLVSENNRRHTQAMQAAQAALRYCEGQLLATGGLTPRAATEEVNAEQWHTFQNWQKDGASTEGGPLRVPADVLNGGSTQPHRYGSDGAPLPQCMAQERNVGGGAAIIVVTARGFSDNFADDSKTGATKSGAVVWLQSFIQLEAVSEI